MTAPSSIDWVYGLVVFGAALGGLALGVLLARAPDQMRRLEEAATAHSIYEAAYEVAHCRSRLTNTNLPPLSKSDLLEARARSILAIEILDALITTPSANRLAIKVAATGLAVARVIERLPDEPLDDVVAATAIMNIALGTRLEELAVALR